jgi:hypothetical protein
MKGRPVKKLAQALLLMTALTTAISAQDESFRLRSFGDPNSYINLQFGGPEVSNVDLGWLNTQWKFVRTGNQGQVALQNLQTGKFLSVIAGVVTAADPDRDPTGRGYHIWNQVYDPISRKISLQHLATKQWLTIGTPSPTARGQLQRRLLGISPTQTAASEWLVAEIPVVAPPAQPQGDVVRLRSVSSPGSYLSCEYANPVACRFNPEWQSEMWEIRQMQRGRFVIVSRSTQKFLSVDAKNQVVMLDPDPARGTNKQPFDGYDVWQTTPALDQRSSSLLHVRSGKYLTLVQSAPSGNENILQLQASSKQTEASSWEMDSRFKSDGDPQEVSGLYRLKPYSNPWHEGWITQSADGTALWTNRAGVSWKLIPELPVGKDGKPIEPKRGERLQPVRILRKEAGSPYQNAPGGQQFELLRDKGGSITGFRFQGEIYSRI